MVKRFSCPINLYKICWWQTHGHRLTTRSRGSLTASARPRRRPPVQNRFNSIGGDRRAASPRGDPLRYPLQRHRSPRRRAVPRMNRLTNTNQSLQKNKYESVGYLHPVPHYLNSWKISKKLCKHAFQHCIICMNTNYLTDLHAFYLCIRIQQYIIAIDQFTTYYSVIIGLFYWSIITFFWYIISQVPVGLRANPEIYIAFFGPLFGLRLRFNLA